MRTTWLFLASTWQRTRLLLLTGLTACTPSLSENAVTTRVLYEQLPVLVRALAKNSQSLSLRMMAPQSASLLPHTNELQVEMQRTGTQRLKTAAGEFSTIVVEVKAVAASEFFPQPERYWIKAHQHFIVRAERNEVGTEAGVLRVNLATYELQDVRRVAYWQMAASSTTNSLADRHSQ